MQIFKKVKDDLGNIEIFPNNRNLKSFFINMKLITINLPSTYLQGIEKLVREDIYPNRSEAIRHAVRDLIKRENAFIPI